MTGERQLPAVRVLLYGDVNLNLLDGSALWLTSMAQVLVLAGCQVDVLLKAPVVDDRLVRSLRGLPGVNLLDNLTGTDRDAYTTREAAQRIAELSGQGYDLVFLRGLAVNQMVIQGGAFTGRLWSYVTDYPQTAAEFTGEKRDLLSKVAAGCQVFFAQTESSRSYLEYHLPELAGKTLLMPPPIPDFEPAEPAPGNPTQIRMIYAGKLAERWRTKEMCELPGLLAREGISASLTVFGDKFHQGTSKESWVGEMTEALGLPGVDWRGGVAREEMLAELGEFNLGMSWRAPELDASHELSTKLLEYGSRGLAALVNRNALHEELLGADYPLYVDGDDPVAAIRAALAEPGSFTEASRRCQRAAQDHTFRAVAQLFQGYLREWLPRPTLSVDQKITVLVAGHDFKFCGELFDMLKAEPAVNLLVDHWSSLHHHDPAASERLLSQADVIMCEWCGPNAVWYADRKRPGQRLVVRLHMFELGGPWMSSLNKSAIDAMVCVSDYYARTTETALDMPEGTARMIPNTIRVSDFKRPKYPGARFNLGLVGVVPLRKRPDRAVELLRELLAHDHRYTLHIRGRFPNEYPWLWRDPVYRSYYQDFFDQMLHDPVLAGHLTWDYFGPDMASWFRGIGWILSPSTDESFHVAPLEGMGSAAVPVIWERPGAEQIFGAQWVRTDGAAELARFIHEANSGPQWQLLGEQAKKEAQRYDVAEVQRSWREVLWE
ncbi:MAG: hypothetical protein Q4B08_08435 [Propionibacteriaceae bacterium]|nr:hypothetical protein [Propionibacteriaceae bacterium]